jgi:hypothetical protein
MAYTVSSSGGIGAQAIADTSTTALHPLGTIVSGWDPTYGHGEFIYLLGVANTTVGTMVTYNATTYQTAIPLRTAGNTGAPVAWAMSANVASSYGWYIIEGNAVAKKDAVQILKQVSLYLGANAGRVKAVASSGTQILGARSANLSSVTSTTSTIVVTISRPHLQGQIT